MRWWLAALAVVVMGAAACASRSSTVGELVGKRIDAAPPPPQPAAIDEAIGGRKVTGYVSVSYGDGGLVGIMSRPGAFASSCKRNMEDWTAGGRHGNAPCATMTLELDGEPPNFWVASYWSAAPGMAQSAEIARTLTRQSSGFIPGVGGAATSTVINSPLLDLSLLATLNMFRDLFEVVGAATPEACEALRPRDDNGLLGDGRCQPAHLDIY
jgi:hypothetical protein